MQLYAIFDRKLKEFGQTVVAERNSSAFLRNVVDGVKRAEGSLMHSHPEDFDVYVLGEIDRETGQITAQAPRLVENVGLALERPQPEGAARLRAEA